MSDEVLQADALLRENAELRVQYLAAIKANAEVAMLNATLQSDLLDRESGLRAAEAQLNYVIHDRDLEHARMAALIEACEAVADFVESYAPSSNLAQTLPTFYANLRVYGKNARAAVEACRSQADALLARLADLSRQIGEQNTTIGYQDAMLAELRAAMRDTIHRVEDVLEGAEIDDGLVHVSALTRLDEHYFQVLKPMRDQEKEQADVA